MSVSIYKLTETYPNTSRIAVLKKKLIITCETYREALDTVHRLNLNKKDNENFVTGDITR